MRTSGSLAQTASLAFVAPSLPVLRNRPPEGPDYIHEFKFDGWRAQISKVGFDITIRSRNGHVLSRKRFRLLYEAAMALRAKRAVIDCEIVAMSDDGRHDFTALMRGERNNLCAWCFDLLLLNDKDLKPLPLKLRRRKLMALLAPTPQHLFRYSEAFDNPHTLLAAAEEMGLEGIVSKRNDQPYVSGRNDQWVKVKSARWRKEHKQRWRMFDR